MEWKCAFRAAFNPHVIPGGKRRPRKQMGTSSQNAPPYCCYDYRYIFYSDETLSSRTVEYEVYV